MSAATTTGRAVFLDRDGTLVHPRHYPSRPSDLCLYDGIGPRLRRLQAAGFRLVVVTNQSGIARGYFTEDDLARMHDHLAAELAREGVRLDGIYHCPHHPDGVIPALAVRCACRKPEPGLIWRAAADLALDLTRSWFIGDILDDVEAGNRAGCRAILVDLGTEARPAHPLRRPTYVARDTRHALDVVAQCEGLASGVELGYAPARWNPSPPHPPSFRGRYIAQQGGAEGVALRGNPCLSGWAASPPTQTNKRPTPTSRSPRGEGSMMGGTHGHGR